jgi:hypothetical protein
MHKVCRDYNNGETALSSQHPVEGQRIIEGLQRFEGIVRLTIFIVALVCILMSSPFSLAAGQRRLPSIEQNRPIAEPELKRQREQAKKLNEERQQALKRDTERLLQLSTELKDYVDKSNENMLSVDVVKKAEQIEKLAHSVKEKMKGGF